MQTATMEMIMKSIAFALGLVGLAVALAAPASACSARGQYCSYPSWAQNAFEGPQGSKPVGAISTRR